MIKAVMPLLHRLRRLVLRVTGWKTRGVKVMVFDAAGRLLLVRNSYGDSEAFLLPGGGIDRNERPSEAARREIMEETGLEVRDLTQRSVHESRLEGRRDTVFLFTARTDAEPTPDQTEVVEAGFFALDDLPPTTSAATLRRIAEYRGERPATVDW